MKKVLLFAGLFTLLIASCGKEAEIAVDNPAGNVADNTVTDLVVRAVIGDGRGTKTVVVPDGDIRTGGAYVYWTSGDAINIFYGSSSSQFTTPITEPAAEASFNGSIDAGESGSGTIWGVYPYNTANTCDGSGVTLTIPSNQSGVAGTFADNLNPTVATSTGIDLSSTVHDLAFYNVGCWFIFSVTREDIVSVTMQGNNSETLVGTVRVEMDGNSRPEVKTVTNGSKSITMTPAGGGCFTKGEYYYMVLIPQTLSDGYSLTLATEDGSFATYTNTGSRILTRSSVNGKLNADDGLTFEYAFVDLGLRVKWASFNVGASKPEEYGDYYAWGETETKDDYSWSTYKWCKGSERTLTKYCNYSSYGNNGFTDTNTTLDPEDDVAHVKWGGSWRMPTKEECDELINNCTWTWCTSEDTEYNRVAGWKVTSKKSGYTDRSIFLPAAGYRDRSSLSGAGSDSGHWSGSLYDDPSLALRLNLYYYNYYILNTLDDYRSRGWPVRPVCP